MYSKSTALMLPLVVSVASATSSSKRGLIYISQTKFPKDVQTLVSPTSDLTWYYNYQPSPSKLLSNTKLEFVPMLFSTADSDGFADTITQQVKDGQNITHVLGFNEPDGTTDTGGSDISATGAAMVWKRQMEPLRDLKIKLGAPAVTGAPTGAAWLKDFFAACNGGCHVDFVCVHWYGNFEGLASHIGEVTSTYPDKDIWVTEYADANVDLTASQSFYNESMALLDRWANVTRYSYFGSFRSSASNVGPNAAMLDQNGALTDIGSWYLGGSATGNIPKAASSGAIERCMMLLVLGLATSMWMV